MQLITAMIKPEKLDDVKKALYEAEVFKMTVTTALGCGQQKGYTESFRGVATEVNLLKKLQIQIAVNDEFVEKTIDAIVHGAKTGNIGDGKIFVTELKDVVRIRTQERGKDAVG
jgi:nitrogen regulatory protein P-II 2